MLKGWCVSSTLLRRAGSISRLRVASLVEAAADLESVEGTHPTKHPEMGVHGPGRTRIWMAWDPLTVPPPGLQFPPGLDAGP